jgi:hypothetical protein
MAAYLYGWQETAFEKVTGLPRRTANFLRDLFNAPEQVASKRLIAFEPFNAFDLLLCHRLPPFVS